jgi:hypothetical protein
MPAGLRRVAGLRVTVPVNTSWLSITAHPLRD